jgi:hypothetical protein
MITEPLHDHVHDHDDDHPPLIAAPKSANRVPHH